MSNIYDPEIDFIAHQYRDNDWLAIVTNSNDPTFSGRCQVKVLGIFDGIEDKMLPWAVPVNSTIFAGDGAGSISIPKVGQFVRVQFNNGDQYAPEYTTIQNIDSELIKRIKDDYQGTHVLLYDPGENITVIYQVNSGFQIFYKESIFQITPDAMISLQTPNIESNIQMDGDTTYISTKGKVIISAASYVEATASKVKVAGSDETLIGPGPLYSHAILAEPLWAMMSVICSAVDAKTPSTPGILTGLCESAKNAATSINVKISV